MVKYTDINMQIGYFCFNKQDPKESCGDYDCLHKSETCLTWDEYWLVKQKCKEIGVAPPTYVLESYAPVSVLYSWADVHATNPGRAAIYVVPPSLISLTDAEYLTHPHTSEKLFNKIEKHIPSSVPVKLTNLHWIMHASIDFPARRADNGLYLGLLLVFRPCEFTELIRGDDL